MILALKKVNFNINFVFFISQKSNNVSIEISGPGRSSRVLSTAGCIEMSVYSMTGWYQGRRGPRDPTASALGIWNIVADQKGLIALV
jgi:hypothetical protein